MNCRVVRTAVVMAPDRHDPRERWGVFNPASARSDDGRLYLFPRMVAAGNYSRIGIAQVEAGADGAPTGVQRIGVTLEPETAYECAWSGLGGVEDPRITYVPVLACCVMTYTALGPTGPRIALAVSRDLFSWRRLGLLRFARQDGIDLNQCVNKDSVLFPEPVRDPAGNRALAILHRPIAPVSDSRWTGRVDGPPSIWISYISSEATQPNIRKLTQAYGHTRLAAPVEAWEQDRIGAGPPPILTEDGWLLFYHGVFRVQPVSESDTNYHAAYHGGAMLLDTQDPRRVLWRSPKPVLHPTDAHGRYGHVPRVVFPTAVDARGQDIDVYCGAADSRIAVITVRIDRRILRLPSSPPEIGEAPEWVA